MRNMNKYPIYIVSKGRWENPLTAKFFIEGNVDFKILVEPQEYDLYCNAIGEKYVLKLPFENLGLGSYPARNYAREHSNNMGSERHWMFDDNIRFIRRVTKGIGVKCNPGVAIKCVEDFTDRYKNVAISAFNYAGLYEGKKKPFTINRHCYLAMLIKNDMPYQWRMKYNEDVDLCLQVLHAKLCTILFNAFVIEKVSTTQKMKGGNQTELYKGNATEKKILKARSLEEVWPKYAKTTIRYGRPHHFVDWNKHFKHPLIRKSEIDLSNVPKIDNFGLKLNAIGNVKSKALQDLIEKSN